MPQSIYSCKFFITQPMSWLIMTKWKATDYTPLWKLSPKVLFTIVTSTVAKINNTYNFTKFKYKQYILNDPIIYLNAELS